VVALIGTDPAKIRCTLPRVTATASISSMIMRTLTFHWLPRRTRSGWIRSRVRRCG